MSRLYHSLLLHLLLKHAWQGLWTGTRAQGSRDDSPPRTRSACSSCLFTLPIFPFHSWTFHWCCAEAVLYGQQSDPHFVPLVKTLLFNVLLKVEPGCTSSRLLSQQSRWVDKGHSCKLFATEHWYLLQLPVEVSEHDFTVLLTFSFFSSLCYPLYPLLSFTEHNPSFFEEFNSSQSAFFFWLYNPFKEFLSHQWPPCQFTQ